MTTKKFPTLLELRDAIDQIDDDLHALLIKRGQVVEEVIAAKKRNGDTGSAFRPAREAELMRRLAQRHQGSWPLETSENIWRVMVATSTYVQVPYAVHADSAGGEAAIRDSARFHFGFTVPFHLHKGATAVIEAVDQSSGDLGMFRLDQGGSGGAWWRLLEDENAPKIIARLPFLERIKHPAGLPVFVISKPLAGGLARDFVLYSLQLERWGMPLTALFARHHAHNIASAGTETGLSLLIALPQATSIEEFAQKLRQEGFPPLAFTEIGSHA